MDVIIGKGCILGSNVRLVRCVIGDKCIIGNNVTIQDSYLMNEVKVESNSKINLSVIGDGAVVQSNSSLTRCLLHHSVLIKENVDLTDKTISSLATDRKSEKISEKAHALILEDSDNESEGGTGVRTFSGLRDPGEESDEAEDSSSESGSDASRSASPQADDCTLFYSEVIDSLQRGYEEKLLCSNLILEVNSSRYAYNVTLSEVTELTTKAVFSMPSRLQKPVKPILVYFKPLFENYVKTEGGQMECLSAFEECYESLGNETNTCIHFLYDADILSEDIIERWYDSLDTGSSLKGKLAKFMTWLREASEESD